MLEVTPKTLREWEKEGKIQPIGTEGGHWRYDMTELIGSKNSGEKTLAYARVSS